MYHYDPVTALLLALLVPAINLSVFGGILFVALWKIKNFRPKYLDEMAVYNRHHPALYDALSDIRERFFARAQAIAMPADVRENLWSQVAEAQIESMEAALKKYYQDALDRLRNAVRLAGDVLAKLEGSKDEPPPAGG